MLENIALFETLADSIRQLLEQQLHVRRADGDAALFSPGDISESTYIASNGGVKIWCQWPGNFRPWRRSNAVMTTTELQVLREVELSVHPTQGE